MKKFYIIFMTIFMLAFTGILASCNFKDISAEFSESEVVFSANDKIDLADYITLENTTLDNIQYQFSNPSLFALNDTTISAKDKQGGKGVVYALYEGSTLASMQLVVRKPFSTPEPIWDERGFVTWDASYAAFEGDSAVTVANSYLVTGRRIVKKDGGTPETFYIDQPVSTNMFKLNENEPGEYHLSVRAEQNGYFDRSDLSAEKTFYVGYMPKLEATDFSLESGQLRWSNVANANYQVRFQGQLLQAQSENFVDVENLISSSPLSQNDKFSFSVLVSDTSKQNKKITQESVTILVTKLAKPTDVSYHFDTDGGKIKINTIDGIDSFDVVAGEQTFSFENTEDVLTDLPDLAAGIYDVKVIAKKNDSEGHFYLDSDAFEFDKQFLKLDPVTFSRGQENEANSEVYHANATLTEQSKVQTKFVILSVSEPQQTEGFSQGSSSVDFDINISDAGAKEYSIKQLPASQENGEWLVLNSAVGQAKTIVKLAQIGTLKHEYKQDKSTISFEKTDDNATKYTLKLLDAEGFKPICTQFTEVDGRIVFELDKKLDEYQAYNGKYTIDVEASTEDETYTINSTCDNQKEIAVLAAPTSVQNGKLNGTTYSWQAVEGASQYKLEYYSIDADTYNSNSENASSFDPASLEKTEVTIGETNYTLPAEGYYFVRVFALSNNEDVAINSTESLKEMVYVTKDLSLGEINFGYDKNLLDGTGYFVKIADNNDENVVKYVISVKSEDGGQVFETQTLNLKDNGIYSFSTSQFESGIFVVEVVAHGNDDTIYQTASKQIKVIRLADVTFEDLVFDDDMAKSITLKRAKGVEKIVVTNKNTNSPQEFEEDAKIDISGEAVVTLDFQLFAKAPNGDDKTLPKTDGEVYLDSNVSSIKLQRLNAPTNLQYKDGKLSFEHSQIAESVRYGIEATFATEGGDQTMSILIETSGQRATVYYNSKSTPLTPSLDVKLFETGGSNAINVQELFKLFEDYSDLINTYNAATSVSFSLWAYQNRYRSDEGYAEITSLPSSDLKVDKIAGTNLTFSAEGSEFTLSWESPKGIDSQKQAETKYEVLWQEEGIDPQVITTSNANKYTFSGADYKTSIFHSFVVKVTNPYFLDSEQSNQVRVYILSRIDKVNLTDAAELVFDLKEADRNFVKDVELTITGQGDDAGQTSYISDGKIVLTASSSQQPWTYTLKVRGKDQDENTYYVDSIQSTWKVSTLEKAVQGQKLEATFEGNVISWQPFAKDMAELEYVIIFKDKNGGTATFTTTQSSINLQDDTLLVDNETEKTLYQILHDLATGNIQVQVCAHIKSHQIYADADNIIYFAEDSVLFTGTEKNYYIYGDGESYSLAKLAQPEVSNVDFVGFTKESVSEEDWIKRQTPNIEITIKGDYGESGDFRVYLNDLSTPVSDLDFTYKNGDYSFVLTHEQYGAHIKDQTLKVRIFAVNDGKSACIIPSTDQVVEFKVASAVKSVDFATSENGEGFSRQLEIGIGSADAKDFSGGIVLKIVYTADAGEQTAYIKAPANLTENKIIFDMASEIDKILGNGGSLQVFAYADNYASGNTYVISCPSMTESETFVVLKDVADVNRTGEGFEIDAELNGMDTTYVIVCDGKTYKLNANEQQRFVFTAPQDWTTNQEYSLNIFASQKTIEGQKYIVSKQKQINFSLNRLGAVAEKDISTERDNFEQSLVWTKVENATNYLLRVYFAGEIETFLYETEVSQADIEGKVKVTLDELFGKGYENLLSNGITTSQLEKDLPLRIEIIAGGDEVYNNSLTTSFNTYIKGNGLKKSDLSINKGLIRLATQRDEQSQYLKYKYRFVSPTGEEIQTWKEFQANGASAILDTSELSVDISRLFEVEIVVIADETTSDKYNFAFDSVAFSTIEDIMTFYKMEDIIDVQFNPEQSSDLNFTLVGNGSDLRQIYVGLKEDDLPNAKLLELSNGVSIEINTYIFSISFMEILRALGAESSSISTLYFWSVADGIESEMYVASNAKAFDFGVIDIAFKEFKKPIEETEGEIAYLTTYALFNNTDSSEDLQTLGFNVLITYVDEEGNELRFNKFVPAAELLSNKNFDGMFAINLLDIFESEIFDDTNTLTLNTLSGDFEIAFSKVSKKGEKYCVSDWLTKADLESGEQTFAFHRLSPSNTLRLEDGTLFWNRADVLAENYYVYFATELNGQKPTSYRLKMTEERQYDASSDMPIEGEMYYLAVRGISKDTFVLSSALAFKTETSGEIQGIFKNKINDNTLTLENGSLQVNWIKDENQSNFFTMFKQSGDLATIASNLATRLFTMPFTFYLTDLLDQENPLSFRLQFTKADAESVGIVRTFTIPAIKLLQSLTEFGLTNEFAQVSQRLRELVASANVQNVQDLMLRLQSAVEDGTYGIGNTKTFFDEILETLQAGQYTLRYCLLGNYHTLTSNWHEFSNGNDNLICVNEEPDQQIIREEISNISNAYKVVIRKSNIYTGKDTTETASVYYVKIGSHRFQISTKSHQLTSLDETEGQVSVYECDEYGTIVDGDGVGTHLMFYLNINNAKSGNKTSDSLLGVFGKRISKVTHQLEICARGNEVSFSSKSELWQVTFLGFATFNTVDGRETTFMMDKGQFRWASQQTSVARDTTVVVKKQGIETEIVQKVDGSRANSVFALDTYTADDGKIQEFGEGMYQYLKFVMLGDAPSGNSVYIDSDIYVLNNVYKLQAPDLSNNLGYLGILSDQSNISILNGIYSDENAFSYSIFNNESTSGMQSRIFDTRSDKSTELLYEVGVTGLVEDEDPSYYAFKSTERLASSFQVSALGTTAILAPKESDDTSNIKNLQCIDKQSGLPNENGFAARSKWSSIDASMLDTVQNVSISDSVISWNAVSGRTGEQLPEGSSVVYRISVERYKIENGQETNVGLPESDPYYTTKTSFDFNILKETEFDNQDVLYRATVRAIVLNVSKERPQEGSFVELTDGSYASGNLQYLSSKYILMSDGGQVSGLRRLNPIENNSVEVSDGHLTWLYRSDSKDAEGNFIVTETNFKSQISFLVQDDDGKTISGDFDVTLQDSGTNLYKITFTENQGAMKTGNYAVTIYTICGSQTQGTALKSFGRKSDPITKLETISAEDYQITADNSNGTETFSLKTYFESNQANLVIATFDIAGKKIIVNFNAEQYQVYILRSEDTEATYRQGDGYVQQNGDGRIVITDNAHATVDFVVSCAGAVTSDKSQEFLLQRSSWGEGSTIHWDSVKGEFTWDFKLRSLNAQTEANQIVYIVSNDTTLYNDETLSEESASEIVLTSGSEINILQLLEDCVKIEHEGGEYYISRDDISRKNVVDENEASVTYTLMPSDLFEIFEDLGSDKIILFDGKYYQISESIVLPEFVVEAKYGIGNSAVTRIYNTPEQVFRPTIIGRVSVTIRIKINSSSLQSLELSTLEGSGVQTGDDGTQFVDFNLFAGGRGTKEDPYSISSSQQFLNIAYRQTKDSILQKFIEQGKDNVTEENKYYFHITSNLQLNTFKGVLFKGEFSGVIDGLNDGQKRSITYTSFGVSENGEIAGVTIRATETAVTGGGNSSNIVYTSASALFEKLTSTAEIKNLQISATYENGGVVENAIVSGLAVTNNGQVTNVDLTHYSTSFVVRNIGLSTKVVIVYCGLVGINTGNAAKISNCNLLTSMNFTDSGTSQLMFIGGLAYTNSATIEACTSGGESGGGESEFEINVTSSAYTTVIQVAGIAVTNTNVLRGCTNNLKRIYVEATKDSLTSCYIGGIMSLNLGSTQDDQANTNNGSLSCTNVTDVKQTDNGIWATTRAASNN